MDFLPNADLNLANFSCFYLSNVQVSVLRSFKMFLNFQKFKKLPFALSPYTKDNVNLFTHKSEAMTRNATKLQGLKLYCNWFSGDWGYIFVVTVEMSRCGQNRLQWDNVFVFTVLRLGQWNMMLCVMENHCVIKPHIGTKTVSFPKLAEKFQETQHQSFLTGPSKCILLHTEPLLDWSSSHKEVCCPVKTLRAQQLPTWPTFHLVDL